MDKLDHQLAPSILAADFGHLTEDVRKVEGICRYLHLDIMDGHYVPNISFGMPVVETLRPYTDMIFDCHLMVAEPDRYIKAFADIGCDMITFHYECSDDPFALIDEIRSLGKKAGIAVHPDTPAEKIYPFLEKGAVDLILVMSVVPGFGGQKYMHSATERLSDFRSRLDKNGSDALLSVDGGINTVTIKEAAAAGATLIVAGSAVFGKEDITGAASDLIAAMKDC